jgi:hypothetical protein
MLAPRIQIEEERLTADGCQPWAEPVETGCCPPPLCGNDLCCTFVAFFNLLPSGPLWDYWKQAAISYFETHDNPAECPLLSDPRCPSLVLHSIYTVLKLRHVVHNALWPALRESSPYTAVTTLDDYLARMRWEDCYKQHCRNPNLGTLTPYEIMGECGPIYCEIEFPEELDKALKRAIAIALTRANMGVIKNLCGINWVIEPLGAILQPFFPKPPPDNNPCYELCVENPEFVLCQTRDWLESAGSGDICDTIRNTEDRVPAYWSTCDKPAGLPATIWPGVLAAECIIRSMLPSTSCQPIVITRCC